MTLAPSKAFLDLFEERQKSNVANDFLIAIRQPRPTYDGTAKTLCSHVYRNSQAEYERRRLRLYSEKAVQREAKLMRALRDNQELALQYAQWCIEYEALPQGEKDRLKAGRGEQYRDEYMRQQPATEKQLNLLHVLGATEVPANRKEASEMIERLKGLSAAQGDRS